jgi:arginine decarboxylase-like protein
MANGKINSTYVICNGFKRDQYIENIARLINNGHKNTIPIIDNFEELIYFMKGARKTQRHRQTFCHGRR